MQNMNLLSLDINMSSLEMLPASTKFWCRTLKWLVVMASLALGVHIIFGNATGQIIDQYWQTLPDYIREVTVYSDGKQTLINFVASLNFIGAFLVAATIFWVFHTLQAHSPFSVQASRALRYLGFSVIAASVLSLVHPTLMMLAMTLNNPENTRVLTIQMSSGHITMGLIGIVLVILGNIMVNAAAIADENKQFI